MDFDLTPEEREFKQGLTAWLKANRVDLGGGDESARRDWIDKRRAWQKRMFDAGYIGLNWPKEYGGKGATLMEQLLFSEALIETGAPQPINLLAPGMLGPTLIAQGNEEQKQRYLPKMLDADEIWCQGFSEPNAGSDLSALKTRAERKGDHYVVNGQKVWTTLAHVAKFCMLLTREFPAENPPDGPPTRLVNTESPAAQLRPPVTITGAPATTETYPLALHDGLPILGLDPQTGSQTSDTHERNHPKPPPEKLEGVLNLAHGHEGWPLLLQLK